MPPGSSVTITARFTPSDATVCVARCVCTIPEDRAHVMTLEGIGKYPFLASDYEAINFGRVLVGATARRHRPLRIPSSHFHEADLR